MLPVITVLSVEPETNINLIARWISPRFNRANKTLPFAEGVYALFPALDGKIDEDMSDAQIREKVTPAVLEKLKENERLIQEKVDYLQAYFHKINNDLLAVLADVHETEWPAGCRQITCYVGYIPRCPRNVETKKFWVSCSMENTKIVTASVHEMGHFMFYEKWKEIYGAVLPKDLGRPSPRWYLEEMVVDPLLNEAGIRSVVPLEQKAYPRFYSETLNGVAIMDYIKDFYANRKSVEDFIQNAYRFVRENVAEIVTKCG